MYIHTTIAPSQTAPSTEKICIACLGNGFVLSGNGLGPCIQQLRLHARLPEAAHNGLGHLDIGSADQDGPTVALVVQHDLLREQW